MESQFASTTPVIPFQAGCWSSPGVTLTSAGAAGHENDSEGSQKARWQLVRYCKGNTGAALVRWTERWGFLQVPWLWARGQIFKFSVAFWVMSKHRKASAELLHSRIYIRAELMAPYLGQGDSIQPATIWIWAAWIKNQMSELVLCLIRLWLCPTLHPSLTLSCVSRQEISSRTDLLPQGGGRMKPWFHPEPFSTSIKQIIHFWDTKTSWRLAEKHQVFFLQ